HDLGFWNLFRDSLGKCPEADDLAQRKIQQCFELMRATPLRDFCSPSLEPLPKLVSRSLGNDRALGKFVDQFAIFVCELVTPVQRDRELPYGNLAIVKAHGERRIFVEEDLNDRLAKVDTNERRVDRRSVEGYDRRPLSIARDDCARGRHAS